MTVGGQGRGPEGDLSLTQSPECVSFSAVPKLRRKAHRKLTRCQRHSFSLPVASCLSLNSHCTSIISASPAQPVHISFPSVKSHLWITPKRREQKKSHGMRFFEVACSCSCRCCFIIILGSHNFALFFDSQILVKSNVFMPLFLFRDNPGLFPDLKFFCSSDFMIFVWVLCLPSLSQFLCILLSSTQCSAPAGWNSFVCPEVILFEDFTNSFFW